MIGIERLADVFVGVADTLVADFDVIEFLHTVAGHATEMTGAAAAGLMLVGPRRWSALHGRLRRERPAPRAVPDPARGRSLPRLLPHRAAGHRGGPDDGASRWPAFTERALASGVRSVHAFPMRLRDQVIGALNVFGAEPRPLDPEEARVVQALADLATIAIIQERLIRQAELLTEQLQFALNSRVVIEQAKGAIARSLGVSVEEAFDLMRGHARRERIGLTDLALRVVESPEGPQLLRPGS